MGAKIGFGELIIILIIALIVLGPEKLPQAGRALGRAVRAVRKYVREATEELDVTEDVKEIRKDIRDIQKDVISMGESLEKSVAEETGKLEADMKAVENDLDAAVKKPVPEGKKTVEPGVPADADENTQEGL